MLVLKIELPSASEPMLVQENKQIRCHRQIKLSKTIDTLLHVYAEKYYYNIYSMNNYIVIHIYASDKIHMTKKNQVSENFRI